MPLKVKNTFTGILAIMPYAAFALSSLDYIAILPWWPRWWSSGANMRVKPALCNGVLNARVYPGVGGEAIIERTEIKDTLTFTLWDMISLQAFNVESSRAAGGNGRKRILNIFIPTSRWTKWDRATSHCSGCDGTPSKVGTQMELTC